MSIQDLIEAIKKNHLNEVKQLTDSIDPGQTLTKEPYQGLNILFMAAALGHLDIVKFLIEQKNMSPSDAIEEGECKGVTPLYIAAAKGRLNVVKHLIGQIGLSPFDSLKEGSYEGKTPAFITAANGLAPIVKYLTGLKNANFNELCSGLIEHYNKSPASANNKKTAFLFYQNQRLLDALENLPENDKFKEYLEHNFNSIDDLLRENFKDAYNLILKQNKITYKYEFDHPNNIPDLLKIIGYSFFQTNLKYDDLSFEEFIQNKHISAIAKPYELAINHIKRERNKQLINAGAEQIYYKILASYSVDKILTGNSDLLKTLQRTMAEKQEAIMPFLGKPTAKKGFVNQYMNVYRDNPLLSLSELFEKTIIKIQLLHNGDKLSDTENAMLPMQEKQVSHPFDKGTEIGFFATESNKRKRIDARDETLGDELLYAKRRSYTM